MMASALANDLYVPTFDTMPISFFFITEKLLLPAVRIQYSFFMVQGWLLHRHRGYRHSVVGHVVV
jgi:hypothetical protein